MEKYKIPSGMNYTDAITHFKSSAHNATNLQEIVTLCEATILEIADVQEASIILIDHPSEELTYLTDDVVLPIIDDGASAILECFYTQSTCHISHARRHSLYRQRYDNPTNQKAEDIVVFPKIKNGKTIALLRIVSIDKEWELTSDIANFMRGMLLEFLYPIAIDAHVADETPTQSPMPEQPPAEIVEQRVVTVLVMDKSTIILRLIQKCLLEHDIHVITTTNGTKGVYLYTTNDIDLIFVDEAMGGLLGHEVIERIRNIEQREESTPIPILGLTTDDTLQARELLLRSGATAVICKPIMPDMVYKLIKQYLTS